MSDLRSNVLAPLDARFQNLHVFSYKKWDNETPNKDKSAFKVDGDSFFDGRVNIFGKLTVSELDVVGEDGDGGINVPGGNDGDVLISNISSNMQWRNAYWKTNDTIVQQYPSDNIIHTEYNIGIGTTNPLEKIDINGNAKIKDIFIGESPVDNSSIISLNTYKTNGNLYSIKIKSDELNLNTSNNLKFNINDSEVARFDNNGNMGIGITNPQANLHIAGSTIVDGNLTVNGNLTTINTETVEIEDSMIYLAKGNNGDNIDFGLFGQYIDSGVTKYTGIFRDADGDTGYYNFFHNLEEKPTTTVNINHPSYQNGNLHVGGLKVDTGITFTTPDAFVYQNDLIFSTVNPSGTGYVGFNVTSSPEDAVDIQQGIVVRDGNLKIGITESDASVHINRNDVIVIPAGDTSERLDITAAIRYNSDTTSFEGYNGTNWGTLGGIKDVDGDTYISAEESSGLDNDELKFYTAGTEKMIINTTGSIGINTTPSNTNDSGIPYQVEIDGWIGITGSIIPLVDRVYNLGSTTHRWGDLYFGGETIYLGDSVLKDYNGTLTITGAAQIDELNITHNLDIDGEINVSGTATINDINITQDLYVSGTSNIYNLNVTNDANISGELSIYDLNVTNNANISNLTVSGDTNIVGAITASSINLSGSGDVNGDLSLSGDVNIGGDANMNSISVTGDADIDGNLDVSGSLTMNFLNVTYDATIGRNLYVTNNTTLQGTLSVTGTSNLNVLNVSGNTDINGTLDVAQAVTMNSTLELTGDANLNGALDVAGTAQLNELNVTGNTNVDGTLDVAGIAQLNTLNVTGDVDVDGSLDVSGSLTMNNISVTNDAIIGDKLEVKGESIFDSIYVTNTSTLQGILTVSNNTNLYNDVNVYDLINLYNENNANYAGQIKASEDTSFNTKIEIISSRGDGGIVFKTNPNNGIETSMFINSDGNVGIGTTSQNIKLDVAGDTQVQNNFNVLNNTDLDGTLNVQNETLLQSTLEVQNSTIVNSLTVTNNSNLLGNLIVDGNLTVQGTTTTVNTEVLTIEDPIIKLGNNNISDAVDLGYYGKYVESGTTYYSGLVRDATDGYFKFYNTETEPTTIVDLNDVSFEFANVQLNDLKSNNIDLDNDINITGDANINNSINVTGNATFESSIEVKSTSQLNELNVTGDVDIDGSLDVSGSLKMNDLTVSRNANIGNNLNVSGNTNLSGNSQLGSLNVTGNTDIDGTLNVENSTILQSTLEVQDIAIINSLKVTGNTNLDGNLDVEGTMSLYNLNISNNATINNNLEVKSNSQLESLSVTNNVGIGIDNPTKKLEVNGDAIIYGNDGFNSNLERGELFLGDEYNSISAVYNQGLSLSTFGATDAMTIQVSTGNLGIGITNPQASLHISGTDSLVIPVGDSSQRIDVTGAIRYNNETQSFEGYSGTWGSLGGVKDVDGDTYVSAEDNAGVDNDELKFFTAGIERMMIGSTGFIGINTEPKHMLDVTGTHDNSNYSSLSLRNGNNALTFSDEGQIRFGWNGSTDYSHFISTKHNSAGTDNSIDFFVNDGTPENTINNGSIHVMSMVDGKVGIGITNPTNRLEVDGNASINDFLGVGVQTVNYPLHVETINNNNWSTKLQNNNTTLFALNTNGNALNINSGINSSDIYLMKLRNNTYIDIFNVNNNGNVGINQPNPSKKLIVNTSKLSDGAIIGDAFIGNDVSVTGTMIIANDYIYSNANDFALKQNINGKTQLNSKAGQDLLLSINNTEHLIIKSDGKIGIHTTNPSEQVEIQDNVLIDTTANVSLTVTNTLSDIYMAQPDGSGIFVQSGTTLNYALKLQENENDLFTVYNNGNVSIGSTEGTNKLTVENGLSIMNGGEELNINVTNGENIISSENQININISDNNILEIEKNNLTTNGDLTVNGDLNITGSQYIAEQLLINTTNSSFQLEVSGDTRLNGDVIISGILSFEGVSVDSFEFQDSLIKLGNNNEDNTEDIGFYGKYIESGITKYTGVYSDASNDNTFVLFKDLESDPTKTVNTSDVTFVYGDLLLNNINSLGEVNVTNKITTLNKVGVGITNPQLSLHISGTDGIVIPVGDISQRVDVTGTIRFNQETQQFEGYSGTWGSLGGVIDVDQDTFISAENNPGDDNDELKFFTSGTEKMIINTTGFIGIGTSPESQLHISSGITGDCKLILESDTDNNKEDDNPYIIFRQDGGIDVSSIYNSHNELNIANSVGQGGIVLKTGVTDGYDNAIERMRIDTSGNIGIGITNPSTSLHISSNDTLVIPVGNTLERIDVTGGIRYNSQLISFEGYDGANWGSLGGVKDVDQDTYISAEDNPGDDNDELKFFTANQQHMIINSTGKIGIGITNPNYALDVNGIIQSNDEILAPEFTATCDIRVKENIKRLDDNFLQKLCDLNLFEYNYTSDYSKNNEKMYGLLAQNVEKVIPEAVKSKNIKIKEKQINDFKTISQNTLITYLIGSIQQLTKHHNNLTNDYFKLKNDYSILRKEYNLKKELEEYKK